MEPGQEIRFKLVLQYDGSRFFGWQIQKSERTVQGEIEAALEHLTGERRPLTGSGRTDRGVHATGQVAAVSLPSRWSSAELKRALNAVLPTDIWVQEIHRVHRDFHPRYDALERSYRYRVGTAEETRSPFHRSWCWPLGAELDPQPMNEAAGALPGRHSFKSFRKEGQPERGEECTVVSAGWKAWDGLGMTFEITADRYLHHMVRYLVGTMVDIGRGRRPLEDFQELLTDPDGALTTSPPAPAAGLFLIRVDYPDTQTPTTREPDEANATR